MDIFKEKSGQNKKKIQVNTSIILVHSLNIYMKFYKINSGKNGNQIKGKFSNSNKDIFIFL